MAYTYYKDSQLCLEPIFYQIKITGEKRDCLVLDSLKKCLLLSKTKKMLVLAGSRKTKFDQEEKP